VAGELRVGAEAVDGADLAEQLRRRERGTTWELEQSRRDLAGVHMQLAIELDDRAAADLIPGRRLVADLPVLCRRRLPGAVERDLIGAWQLASIEACPLAGRPQR